MGRLHSSKSPALCRSWGYGMNTPTQQQCCAFAAWTVVSETRVEQVWANMCPTHGQTGPEVVLARYPGPPQGFAGDPTTGLHRIGVQRCHRGPRAA